MDELQRLCEVHEHGFTLVLAHGLEPGRVPTGSVHQRIDTPTEYFTELRARGEREREGERERGGQGREAE